MKQLICTDEYLLLMADSIQGESNTYSSNAKNLGAVVSHLPLYGAEVLKGIPLMPSDDFIVVDFINLRDKIILIFKQGESSDTIQCTFRTVDVINFFKDSVLGDFEYFFYSQGRLNILSNLTNFINAIKARSNEVK